VAIANGRSFAGIPRQRRSLGLVIAWMTCLSSKAGTDADRGRDDITSGAGRRRNLVKAAKSGQKKKMRLRFRGELAGPAGARASADDEWKEHSHRPQLRREADRP